MNIQTSLLIISILFAHFIGDFILQSDEMAINKSKDNKVLLEHAGIYMLPFYPLCFIFDVSIVWIIVNSFLHYVVDWGSSKLTSKLYQEHKRHWFFVTIGADQLIHQILLIGSLIIFLNYLK